MPGRLLPDSVMQKVLTATLLSKTPLMNARLSDEIRLTTGLAAAVRDNRDPRRPS
jgi:hypothetical protein